MRGIQGQDSSLQESAATGAPASPAREQPLLREPFGETATPSAYVRRDETDRVLSALHHGVIERGGIAALSAAPGMGKTMLLHLLKGRLREKLRCVFLPYGALELDELCAWTLGLLGEAVACDPVDALMVLARQLAEADSGLLIVVDDATAMPLTTVRALAARAGSSGAGLRIVLGVGDDARSSRVLAAAGTQLWEERLSQPLTEPETEHYLRTRLALARVDEALSQRFDARAVAGIHRLSGGVPRRIHELASLVITDLPEGVKPVHSEVRWLAVPLDGGEELDAGSSDVHEELELDPPEQIA